MKQYVRGETPALYHTVNAVTQSDTNVLSDGALTNPATSIKCIIWDSVHDVVQTEDDCSNLATGKYVYSGYTIGTTAKLGIYDYEIRAIDGSSKKAVGQGSFEVVAQIE